MSTQNISKRPSAWARFSTKVRLMNNFFRKDLMLNNCWWHRLLFVLFIIAFITTIAIGIFSMFSNGQLPRYTKVGMLSDRMGLDVQLIGDLVLPQEKIAYEENNLYYSQDYYDRNGGWLLKQKEFCSKNIADQIENVSKKTGINFYIGDENRLLSFSDFRNYLEQVNANCVEIHTFGVTERFGVNSILGWGVETNNMAIWKESIIKSVLFVLRFVLSVIFIFILIAIVYYKVFLYIIFGRRKDLILN